MPPSRYGTVNSNIANGSVGKAGILRPNAEAAKTLCRAAVYNRFRLERFEPKLSGWQRS
jgi:hypothetical protein